MGSIPVRGCPGRGPAPRLRATAAPGRRSDDARPHRLGRWPALTVVLALLDVVVTAQYRALLSEEAVAQHGFPFVTARSSAAPCSGRSSSPAHERHPIGWLLMLVGVVSGALSLLAEAYSIWVRQRTTAPGSRSLGGVAGWVSSLIGGQLAIAGLALMFLLAPDGHFLSRRWRYAAWVHRRSGWLLCLGRPPEPSTRPRFDLADARTSVRSAASCFTVGFLLIAVGVLASVVSMVLRLRRSRGEQRQQLRLIAAGAL